MRCACGALVRLHSSKNKPIQSSLRSGLFLLPLAAYPLLATAVTFWLLDWLIAFGRWAKSQSHSPSLCGPAGHYQYRTAARADPLAKLYALPVVHLHRCPSSGRLVVAPAGGPQSNAQKGRPPKGQTPSPKSLGSYCSAPFRPQMANCTTRHLLFGWTLF